MESIDNVPRVPGSVESEDNGNVELGSFTII